MEIPFVTPSSEHTENFYFAERRGRPCLRGTPGLLTAHSTSKPVRGLFSSKGVGYAVCGNTFYTFDGYTITSRGTLSTSSGRVSISSNGVDVVVVDGTTTLNVYTIATQAFTTVSIPETNHIAFFDGFYLIIEEGTQQFWKSASYDSSTWNGLDFASAESQPDNAITHIADHSEYWVFGTESIDVFYNSGNSDFPIERMPNGKIERGCGAEWSVAKMDNTVFWLGDDGVVYRADGIQPIRVSDDVRERAWDNFNWADAEAFTYTEHGHKFYCLRFPTNKRTFCFDVKTNSWHERSSRIGEDFNNAWRARHYCYLNNTHFVGDDDGTIYRMSTDYLDEAGETIRRTRVSTTLSDSRKRARVTRFELDLEAGKGLATGQGSDPCVWLSWSDDRQQSWANNVTLKLGKTGEYSYRAMKTRLGLARERSWRIIATDPIDYVITGAHMDFELGYS